VTILPADKLPKIGWFGTEPLELARFEPVGPIPLRLVAEFTKPTGGLWTSPVARAGRHEQIVGTDWTLHEGVYRPFTLIRPHKLTRVAVIAGKADLAAVIERFPDTRLAPYQDLAVLTAWDRLAGREQQPPPCRVDWPAMATQFDALYLTHHGVKALNLPYDPQHLWGWDVATVLFLNPTFSPGRIITPPPAETVRAMHADKFRRDMRAMVAAGRITAEQAGEAAALFDDLLAVGDAG